MADGCLRRILDGITAQSVALSKGTSFGGPPQKEDFGQSTVSWSVRSLD